MKNFQAPCLTAIPKPKNNIKPGEFKAVFERESIWRPGTTEKTNKVTITDGTYNCADCTTEAAWSLVGNNSSLEEPSMNLGYIDPPLENFTFNGVKYEYDLFKDETRNFYEKYPDSWKPGATVIHEFCHLFGMLHEHQNNLGDSNTIKINKNKVIDYYMKLGYSYENAKITATNNVLDKYSCTSTENDTDTYKYIGSNYDKDSIMLYALPDEWVDGKNPTKPNFVLSKTDILWLNKNYPDVSNYPIINIRFINELPPWKIAWIQKVIVEKLLPHICIGFIFDGPKRIVIKPKNVRYKTITSSENITNNMSKNNSLTNYETFNNNQSDSENIIRIISVIISIIVVLVCVVDLYNSYYEYSKSKSKNKNKITNKNKNNITIKKS